jgi:hypothetical protein
MVHDQKKSDMWYHDAVMPTCIIRNWVHLLKEDNDLSQAERDEICDKILVEVELNKNILYEEYIEKQRLENVAGAGK